MTDSLSALNRSATELATVLTIKGWQDLGPEIYAAESKDREKQRRLESAWQNYVLEPSTH